MKNVFLPILSLLLLVPGARADELCLSSGGTVAFAEGGVTRLLPLITGESGKFWGPIVSGGAPDERSRTAKFDFMLRQTRKRWTTGRVTCEPTGDGAVRITYRFDPKVRTIKGRGTGMALVLPVGDCLGRSWQANGGEERVFADKTGRSTAFSKPSVVRTFRLDAPEGAYRFEFPVKTLFSWRDARPESEHYQFRFLPVATAADPPGKSLRQPETAEVEFPVVVRKVGADGLKIRVVRPDVIAEGPQWARLDYRKDIVAGSALDFSSVSGLDAPAGKYGWLKAVGGHFEFEKRPGRTVRFWGANLTGGACFPPTPAAAAQLADRLARIGYNSVRIHHHDWGCSRGFDETGKLSASYMERLDRLLAECFRRGIYATTDLFVSRDVPWRAVGVDRPGKIGHNHFKAEVLFREGAYSNYCAFAREFLTHRNPHTGRRYADEPALGLISLVNEGLCFSGWHSIVREPEFQAEWRRWMTAERRRDPNCYPGIAVETPPDGYYRQKVTEGPRAEAMNAFSAQLEDRFYRRMSAFVRELGCKALLTDVNFGPAHGVMREMRRRFDYVDMHAYYEHPQKSGDGARSCANAHPLVAKPEKLLRYERKRFADRPFTVSEYNWCAPNEYRAIGALLGAAVAAKQDWCGVWRFAYSQGGRNLGDNQGHVGAFDVATDPVQLAMERAAAALYLRGDLKAEPKLDPNVNILDLASSVYRPDAKKGSLAVETPRTCGGYAAAGDAVSMRYLSFRARKAAAAVWATSLDARPLDASGRIVLFHVTDALAEGTTFADRTHRTLRDGTGPTLVRRGTAEVRLALKTPASYRVFALDMVGNRLGEVKATVAEGGLVLTVDSSGLGGTAVMQYEIVACGKKGSL